MQKRVLLQMMTSLGLTAGASRVFAHGEASGPAVVGYPSATGPLGEVIVNPYGIAP